MSKKHFQKKVFKLLDLPVEDGQDSLEIGEFCPADSSEIVTEISRLRVQQLSELLRLHLYPDNHQMIQSMSFHTFRTPDLMEITLTPVYKSSVNLFWGNRFQ